MRALHLGLSVLLTLSIGCAAVAKEAEDEAPLDGKSDSFRRPTEHGELRWGSASQTSLSDDERFHAWTFRLSDRASVALEVGASDANLDTVMYLYRRDDPAANWGAYVERNDDDGARMQSAIRQELGAGEYRVVVKGYKISHRGPFALTGTCEGAGCAGAPGPGDVTVPDATEFTDGCVNRLWESMGSAVVSRSSFTVSPAAHTGFDRAVLVATAHYAGMSEWREFVDPADRDGFTFDVDYVQLAGGAVVRMEDGGDESSTDYAFDAEGNLLAYYVHNQSPWTEYFCAGPTDETRPAPEDDCLSAWVARGPHQASTERRSRATYRPGTSTGLDPSLQLAVATYIERELDGEDLEIAIELRAWDAEDGTGVAALLSNPSGVLVEYTVVDSEHDEPWLVFESSENSDEGMQMVCLRP